METGDFYKFHYTICHCYRLIYYFQLYFAFALKKIKSHLAPAKIRIGTAIHLSPSPRLRHPHDSVTILQTHSPTLWLMAHGAVEGK